MKQKTKMYKYGDKYFPTIKTLSIYLDMKHKTLVSRMYRAELKGDNVDIKGVEIETISFEA